mmetsp:Transcript_33449/g.56176  ORF Transcript_33449/g.56176 Transcript_33449/m.56176 type:complete len:207 (+) Transcript_33449:6462-7082(+)
MSGLEVASSSSSSGVLSVAASADSMTSLASTLALFSTYWKLPLKSSLASQPGSPRSSCRPLGATTMKRCLSTSSSRFCLTCAQEESPEYGCRYSSRGRSGSVSLSSSSSSHRRSVAPSSATALSSSSSRMISSLLSASSLSSPSSPSSPSSSLSTPTGKVSGHMTNTSLQCPPPQHLQVLLQPCASTVVYGLPRRWFSQMPLSHGW